MVRLAGFSAINQDRQDERLAGQETLEAQETRIIDDYERALHQLSLGDGHASEALFSQILSDALVKDGATEQLQRVRYLSLKNLATIISGQADRIGESLELYARAADELDAIDVSLWDRYGTLAAVHGEWALARNAFQRALTLDPLHPTLRYKLMQILVHIGDYISAELLGKNWLEDDPSNPVAKRIVGKSQGLPFLDASTASSILELPPMHIVDDFNKSGSLSYLGQLASVPLKERSWTHLLEQCATLLNNPITAVANINFQIPDIPLVEATAADQMYAVDDQVPVPQENTNAEGDQAPCDRTVANAAEGMSGGAMLTTIEKASDASAAVGQSEAVEVTKNPAAQLEEDYSRSLAPQAGQGDVPCADDPRLELNTKGDPGVSSFNEARPTRSTRSRHKIVPREVPLEQQDKGAVEDTYALLRILGATLPEVEKIQWIDASFDEYDRSLNERGLSEGDSRGAQWEALYENIVAQKPTCMLHVASSLLIKWTDVAAACFLKSVKGISALLQLAMALHKRQWPGTGMPTENCLVLAELFTDVATQLQRRSARTDPSLNTRDPALQGLLQGATLWFGRYLARQASKSSDVGFEPENQARYWWSRGRLHEAAAELDRAGIAFVQCQSALESVGVAEVLVRHCETDSGITLDEISGKLEVLQLHAVLGKAQRIAAENRPEAVIATLAPVLLTSNKKEHLMATADRATWVQALELLRDTSLAMDNLPLALRSWLRLLNDALPPVPRAVEAALQSRNCAEVQDEGSNLNAGPIDIHKLMACGASEVLAASAIFLRAYATKLIEDGLPEDGLTSVEWAILRGVIRQALSLVHFCGASLASGREQRHPSLSTRVSVLRHAMSDASVVALHFWALDPLGNHSLEAILDWCYGLCEALGDAGALAERHGALPKAVLCHLRGALPAAEVSSLTAPAVAPTNRDELLESLRNGVDHCILWLYGLRMRLLDYEPWGGEYPMETLPAGGLCPLTTQEDVLDLWPLVEGFLCEQNKAGLLKCSGFLNLVFQLFSELPPSLCALSKAAWKEIDQTNPPEVGSLGVLNPFEGLLQRALDADALSHGVSLGEVVWFRHLSVLRNIFGFRAIMAQDLASSMSATCEGEGFLSPGSLVAVEEYFASFEANVTLNPQRLIHGGWQDLIKAHGDAVDLILLTAAKEVPANDWPYRPDLHRRLAMHHRRELWSAAIGALYSTDDESRAALLDHAGYKLYETVADVPPAFDQLTVRPARNDPELLRNATAALRNYQGAADLLPDEWTFQMQIGRALRRLGHSPEQWLPYLARACHAAVEDYGGLLEPLYTLHAARLKLAVSVDADSSEAMTLVHTIARHCFLPEIRKQLKHLASVREKLDVSILYSDQELLSVRSLLIQDATAAMEWCMEKDKYYHRPVSALAKMMAKEGKWDAVVEYLSPLFTKKTQFGINMWQRIEDNVGKAARKGRLSKKASGKGQTTMGAPLDDDLGDSSEMEAVLGDADLTDPTAIETTYGLRPDAKNLGIGAVEKGGVYLGRVRKALFLYLNALLRTGRIESLAAAANFFKSEKEKEFQGAGFDDFRQMTQGYMVLGLVHAGAMLCSPTRLTAPAVDGPCPSSSSACTDVYERQLREVAATLEAGTAESILQRMFSVWTDNRVLASNELRNWDAMVVEPMRHVVSAHLKICDGSEPLPGSNVLGVSFAVMTPSEARLQNSASMAFFHVYALLYVHLLGVMQATDKLRAILSDMKKRFDGKVARLGWDSRILAKSLCFAAAVALRSEVSSILRESNTFIAELPSADQHQKEEAIPAQMTSAPTPHSTPGGSTPLPGMLPLLSPEQDAQIRALAMVNTRRIVQAQVASYLEQGRVLPLTTLQLLQEQQYLQQYARLVNQTRIAMAVQQASQGSPRAGFQTQMQPQLVPQPQPAVTHGAGLPGAQQRSREIDLQVQAALKKVHAFIRGCWLWDGTEESAFLGGTLADAEDVMLELLDRHLELVRTPEAEFPRDRTARLKLCDELAKKVGRVMKVNTDKEARGQMQQTATEKRLSTDIPAQISIHGCPIRADPGNVTKRRRVETEGILSGVGHPGVPAVQQDLVLDEPLLPHSGDADDPIVLF